MKTYDRTCEGCRHHLGGNKCKFWEDGTCFMNGCSYKQYEKWINKKEVTEDVKIHDNNTNAESDIEGN